MANANDEAAKKAAEEAAAKKAAEKKAKGDKRTFTLIHNVMLSGDLHLAGATVEITRDEHAALAAGGSVTGGWDD